VGSLYSPGMWLVMQYVCQTHLSRDQQIIIDHLGGVFICCTGCGKSEANVLKTCCFYHLHAVYESGLAQNALRKLDGWHTRTPKSIKSGMTTGKEYGVSFSCMDGTLQK
jgi:hypothetical protein